MKPRIKHCPILPPMYMVRLTLYSNCEAAYHGNPFEFANPLHLLRNKERRHHTPVAPTSQCWAWNLDWGSQAGHIQCLVFHSWVKNSFARGFQERTVLIIKQLRQEGEILSVPGILCVASGEGNPLYRVKIDFYQVHGDVLHANSSSTIQWQLSG